MTDFNAVYAAAYARACASRNSLPGQETDESHKEAIAAVVAAAQAATAVEPVSVSLGCANAGCPAAPARDQVYCTVGCATDDAYRPLPGT